MATPKPALPTVGDLCKLTNAQLRELEKRVSQAKAARKGSLSSLLPCVLCLQTGKHQRFDLTDNPSNTWLRECLVIFAQEGNGDAVKALLNAGVSPNASVMPRTNVPRPVNSFSPFQTRVCEILGIEPESLNAIELALTRQNVHILELLLSELPSASESTSDAPLVSARPSTLLIAVLCCLLLSSEAKLESRECCLGMLKLVLQCSKIQHQVNTQSWVCETFDSPSYFFCLKKSAHLVGPLHCAVLAGDGEVTKMLLDADANPNFGATLRGAVGISPLIISASVGNFEMVRFLLNRGADVTSYINCQVHYNALFAAFMGFGIYYANPDKGTDDEAMTHVKFYNTIIVLTLYGSFFDSIYWPLTFEKIYKSDVEAFIPVYIQGSDQKTSKLLGRQRFLCVILGRILIDYAKGNVLPFTKILGDQDLVCYLEQRRCNSEPFLWDEIDAEKACLTKNARKRRQFILVSACKLQKILEMTGELDVQEQHKKVLKQWTETLHQDGDKVCSLPLILTMSFEQILYPEAFRDLKPLYNEMPKSPLRPLRDNDMFSWDQCTFPFRVLATLMTKVFEAHGLEENLQLCVLRKLQDMMPLAHWSNNIVACTTYKLRQLNPLKQTLQDWFLAIFLKSGKTPIMARMTDFDNAYCKFGKSIFMTWVDIVGDYDQLKSLAMSRLEALIVWAKHEFIDYFLKTGELPKSHEDLPKNLSRHCLTLCKLRLFFEKVSVALGKHLKEVASAWVTFNTEFYTMHQRFALAEDVKNNAELQRFMKVPAFQQYVQRNLKGKRKREKR